MKRLDYEAPTKELIVVEMEDGFLGGSVVTDTTQGNIKTTGHELNEVNLDGKEEWNDGTEGWEWK